MLEMVLSCIAAFLIGFLLSHLLFWFIHNRSEIAYFVTTMKEDLANIQVKIENLMSILRTK